MTTNDQWESLDYQRGWQAGAAAERVQKEQKERDTRALAFNAVCYVLNESPFWLPLSVRQYIADAVIDALGQEQRPVTSRDSPPPLICGLCANPVSVYGFADGKHLCHSSERDCYHRWTVYGERPGTRGTSRQVGAEVLQDAGQPEMQQQIKADPAEQIAWVHRYIAERHASDHHDGYTWYGKGGDL